MSTAAADSRPSIVPQVPHASLELWRSLQVPPQLVEWQTEAAHGQHPDLFTPTPQVTPCEDLPPAQQRPLTVPRWWPELGPG